MIAVDLKGAETLEEMMAAVNRAEAENMVATAKARVEAQLRDDERQRLLELIRSTRLPNMAQVREALIFLLAGTK
jgi:capsule polysaccharide export protein KpsE/RkpR